MARTALYPSSVPLHHSIHVFSCFHVDCTVPCFPVSQCSRVCSPVLDVNGRFPHRKSENETALCVVQLRPIEFWCTWPQICHPARFPLPSVLLLRVSTSYEDRDVSMGKADVEEWVLASTAPPNDSDDTGTRGWDKNRVLAEWSEGIQIIRTNLSSSSTKNRAEFLKGLVIPLVKDESEFPAPEARGDHKTEPLEDLTATQTLEIFGIFAQVYPRYTDAMTREIVEEVITQIVLRDQPQGGVITEKILGWFASEASRVSKQVLPGCAQTTTGLGQDIDILR